MRVTVKWVEQRNRWRLEYRKAGIRRRTFFKTKALAEGEAVHLKSDLDRAGAVWVAMSAADRNDLMSVVSEVLKAGLSVRQVWEEYRAGKTSKASPAVTLATARTEYLSAQGNRVKPRYLTQLKQFTSAFCRGREALQITAIQPADLQAWLDLHSIRHRPTVRGRLIGWFEFCVRRGWLTGNPWNRIEIPRVQHTEREVFSVKQTSKTLQWLRGAPAMGAWFVLSTFAGLRPEEAMKTTWDAISTDENWIRVEGQTSKTGLRRVVYPRQGVIKLLLWFKDHGAVLPIGIDQLRAERRKLAEHLGHKKWPKDVTRHTAASMWVAAEQDVALVATMLGHSQATLHRHYKALVTMADAQKFWELLVNF